jgi:hypothetical protein
MLKVLLMSFSTGLGAFALSMPAMADDTFFEEAEHAFDTSSHIAVASAPHIVLTAIRCVSSELQNELFMGSLTYLTPDTDPILGSIAHLEVYIPDRPSAQTHQYNLIYRDGDLQTRDDKISIRFLNDDVDDIKIIIRYKRDIESATMCWTL